jgi:hypothetical protein
MRDRVRTALFTTAGAGLGVVTNVITAYLPNAPHWFLASMFWVAMSALFVPIPTVYMWDFLSTRMALPRIKWVATIVAVWVTAGWIFWLFTQDTLKEWQGPLGPPDVAMCLVYPERPALLLANQSDQVAEQIKYTYVLFDLDSSTPDVPLMIPIGLYEFIKPRSWGGPMNIFDQSLVAPAIKNGDRIVGSIGVQCPKCSVGRSYLVSMVLGQGGWYSLIKGQTSGTAFAVRRLEKPGPGETIFLSSALLPILDKVTKAERLEIEGLKYDLSKDKPDTSLPYVCPKQ